MSAEADQKTASPSHENPIARMKMSLLRNELRWALPLAALGVLVHVLAQISEGWGSAWNGLDEEWVLVSVSFFAFSAPVVAAVAVLLDELTRTREYLLHRPVTPRRLFLTRHLVGLGVLVACAVLTPPLHLALCYLLRESTQQIQLALLPGRVALVLPGLAIYAVTVFGLTAARSLWGGGALAIATATTTGLSLAAGLLLPGTPAMVQTLSVVGTPLLLWAAYHCQRQGRDPDRPWSTSRMRLAAPALLLVAGVVGAATLTLLHYAASAGLYELYPNVARYGDRYLLRKWDEDERVDRQVDAQHRPGTALGEEDGPGFGPGKGPWDELEYNYREWEVFPRFGNWANGRLVVMGIGGARGRPVYYVSDGHVYLHETSADRRRTQRRERKLGKGREGRPFSPQSRLVSDQYARVAIINDPTDGGLWLYDLHGEAPGFTVLPMPAGDRFVAMDHVHRPLGTFPGGVPIVVVGERGEYLLEDGQWKPVPEELARERSTNPRLHNTVTFDRAGRFTATIEHPKGKVLFTHHYRPHTFSEKTLELLSDVPTLLRSPVTTIPALWRTKQQAYDPSPTLLLDPAVAMGTRWTLIGNLLICLVLGGVAFMRLRRLGASPGRRAFWTGAALLGGLPGYLCYRLVETDRAWKPVTLAAPVKAPAARLLLTT